MLHLMHITIQCVEILFMLFLILYLLCVHTCCQLSLVLAYANHDRATFSLRLLAV